MKKVMYDLMGPTFDAPIPTGIGRGVVGVSYCYSVIDLS